MEAKSIALFERLGYDCSAIRNKGRKLILPVPGSNLEVVLAKAADVATYVENGVCDLGILGKDTILEAGGTFYEVADLGFGRCRFALAVPQGVDFYAGYHTRCIASKYVHVTKGIFERKNMDVKIVKIEGSVELAPILGLSDGIVDIVETGATLRENGLVVAEYLTEISARLIVNIASLKLRKAEIEPFIDQIEHFLAKEGTEGWN